MTTGPVVLRGDWQHTDGKGHVRLEDSWDDLDQVHKVAMLSYDTPSLSWVPFTGGGGGGGGGGGPATIADGADVTQGAKADAAWDGAAAAPTQQGVLKYVGQKLEAVRALLAGTLTVGLPAGAATAARQDTGNTSLGSIDTKTPALVGGRVPVDPSGVTSPISAAALPLPAGAATSALQGTGNTSAANLDTTTGAKADAAWDLVAASPSSVSIWKKVAGLLDSIRVSLAGTLVVTTTQLPAALTAGGNLKVSISEDGGAVISVDDNGGSLTIDSPNLDAALSTRLKPADTLAGVTTIGSIAGALPAGTNLIGQAAAPPATLVVTAVSAANTAVTLTLPAVVAQFHYISRIIIERIATTAIAGTALLTYTSTNLPGAWARSTGNAAAVGVQNKDIDESLTSELKSSVANTNTTIVAPAAGATGIVRITVYYRTGV